MTAKWEAESLGDCRYRIDSVAFSRYSRRAFAKACRLIEERPRGRPASFAGVAALEDVAATKAS